MASKRHTTALIGLFLTATDTYQLTDHRNESNELYQIKDIIINLGYNFKCSEKMVGIFQIRRILSIAASIFDPIGWLLPVVMKLRIEIQRLWQKGYDWDDTIKYPVKGQLKKVLISLKFLNEVRIPRWIEHSSEGEEIELIGFSGASSDGYAAVIYNRTKASKGYTVRLIAARGPVTPLKTRASMSPGSCTIPKLELESVVLLAESYRDVRNSLRAIPIRFIAYTDSEVALCWIRSQKAIENKLVRGGLRSCISIFHPGIFTT